LKKSLNELYELYSLLQNNTNIVTDALILLGNHHQSRERVHKKVENLCHIPLNKYVIDLLKMDRQTLIAFGKSRIKQSENFDLFTVNIENEYKEAFKDSPQPELKKVGEFYYTNDKEITKELYNYARRRQGVLFK